jgi:hypothetical protein
MTTSATGVLGPGDSVALDDLDLYKELERGVMGRPTQARPDSSPTRSGNPYLTARYPADLTGCCPRFDSRQSRYHESHPILGGFQIQIQVTRAGFEPAISTLRG